MALSETGNISGRFSGILPRPTETGVSEIEGLRRDIHASLHEPLELELFEHIAHPRPGKIAIMRNLSLPRATIFFGLFRDEIERARQNPLLRLQDELDIDTIRREGGETIFDHEMAHIDEAARLGVDLSKCEVNGYFTENDKGELNLALAFNSVSSVDDDTAIRIALAPQRPSVLDFRHIEPLLDNYFQGIDEHPERDEVLQLLLRKQVETGTMIF